MNKYLENFYNLYSDDDQTVYKAVLDKQTWLNKEFYLIMQLSNNSDLEDLFERRLRFKRLYLNPGFFSGDDELYKEANQYFNDNFRVLYLFDEMPSIDERYEFIIKIDFRKLPISSYRMLFSNYFPCIDQREIPEVKDSSLESLFPLSMNKELGDGVIILDNNALIDNTFPANVLSEIIMGAHMNDGFEVYLKKASEALGVNFRRLKKDDYER